MAESSLPREGASLDDSADNDDDSDDKLGVVGSAVASARARLSNAT